MKTGNFSDKMESFCQEYMKDFNGAAAAVRAGYKCKTPNRIAAKLFARADVRKRIKELKEEISKRHDITQDMIVEEFAKIAFFNIQDYLKTNSTLEDLKKLDRDKAAAISSIKIIETGSGKRKKVSTEIKFHDKNDALENLGKHLGIFEKDNKQRAAEVTISEKTQIRFKKRAE